MKFSLFAFFLMFSAREVFSSEIREIAVPNENSSDKTIWQVFEKNCCYDKNIYLKYIEKKQECTTRSFTIVFEGKINPKKMKSLYVCLFGDFEDSHRYIKSKKALKFTAESSGKGHFIYSFNDKYTQSFQKIFKVFYKRKILPDLILDDIIEKLGIPDFRKNINKLMSYINKFGQLTPDQYIQEVQSYLSKNIDKRNTQLILANFITTIYKQYLKSDNFQEIGERTSSPEQIQDIQKVCQALCPQVTDTALSEFSWVKKIEAEINRALVICKKEEIFTKHYPNLLELLLQAVTFDPKDQSQSRNLCDETIAGFVSSGGFPSITPLPPQLKGLTISVKSLVNSLEVNRLLTQENEQLRKENQQLRKRPHSAI